MTSLKDAIETNHRIAESAEFNKLLLSGNVTTDQYLLYLRQLLHIFFRLEQRNVLPINDMRRADEILIDMEELNETNEIYSLLPTTFAYGKYLLTLPNDKLMAHVYLHYLALLFGGQMMKKKVPGSGRLYTFKNAQEIIKTIRSIQQDSWADEANYGLTQFNKILDELHEVFRPASKFVYKHTSHFNT